MSNLASAFALASLIVSLARSSCLPLDLFFLWTFEMIELFGGHHIANSPTFYCLPIDRKQHWAFPSIGLAVQKLERPRHGQNIPPCWHSHITDGCAHPAELAAKRWHNGNLCKTHGWISPFNHSSLSHALAISPVRIGSVCYISARVWTGKRITLNVVETLKERWIMYGYRKQILFQDFKDHWSQDPRLLALSNQPNLGSTWGGVGAIFLVSPCNWKHIVRRYMSIYT